MLSGVVNPLVLRADSRQGLAETPWLYPVSIDTSSSNKRASSWLESWLPGNSSKVFGPWRDRGPAGWMRGHPCRSQPALEPGDMCQSRAVCVSIVGEQREMGRLEELLEAWSPAGTEQGRCMVAPLYDSDLGAPGRAHRPESEGVGILFRLPTLWSCTGVTHPSFDRIISGVEKAWLASIGPGDIEPCERPMLGMGRCI